MTSHPSQTILRVIGGSAEVPVFRLVAGNRTAPFTVGSRGDWSVTAPGVEAIHFFLAFDGQELYIAGSPSGPQVFLNGGPVTQEWTRVPASAELRFGQACVSVSHEGGQAPAIQPSPTVKPLAGAQHPSAPPPPAAPFPAPAAQPPAAPFPVPAAPFSPAPAPAAAPMPAGAGLKWQGTMVIQPQARPAPAPQPLGPKAFGSTVAINPPAAPQAYREGALQNAPLAPTPYPPQARAFGSTVAIDPPPAPQAYRTGMPSEPPTPAPDVPGPGAFGSTIAVDSRPVVPQAPQEDAPASSLGPGFAPVPPVSRLFGTRPAASIRGQQVTPPPPPPTPAPSSGGQPFTGEVSAAATVLSAPSEVEDRLASGAPGHAPSASSPPHASDPQPFVHQPVSELEMLGAGPVTVSDDGALREQAGGPPGPAIPLRELEPGAPTMAASELAAVAQLPQQPPPGYVAPGAPARGGYGYEYPPPGAPVPGAYPSAPLGPEAYASGAPAFGGQPQAAPSAHAFGAHESSTPSAPPPPQTKTPQLVQVWKETSWSKKALLLLVPVAAYLALFWDPTASNQAGGPKGRASSAVKVSSSNRAAKATPSTTAQPEQAEPEQAEQPEQGAPSQPAAPAPAEASPEDSPAQAATTAPAAEETTAPDVPADEGSEAGTAGGLDPESTDQRDALNAAFEGNLPEAASRYDQLAKSSGAPVFSLAARLAREQAVRKP